MPKTGDLIFFRDYAFERPEYSHNFLFFLRNIFNSVYGFLTTRMYERFTYHIGMVVERKDIPTEIALDQDNLFIWESRGKGVNFNSYKKRLIERKETVYVRPINPAFDETRIKKLQSYFLKAYNTPFENNKWEFVNSFLDLPFLPQNKPDPSHLFCSELMTETLKSIDLLDESIISNEMTPDDFSFERQAFVLKHRFFYGQNVFIKINALS